MPLTDIFRAVREQTQDQRNAYVANNQKLAWRLADVFARTWDLGFTAFGGPAVHFQILHRRFVEGKGGKTPWIDEQTYQELFAICQALPGPGSTKMAFCIALIHAGFWPALFVFITWSMPGAIGMFALSLGVQRIDEVLPKIVYALLSGLNASTVGIIALAAVQLAEKAIKDRLTRILVIFGACAGLCYNALWYFPVLMFAGGIATVIWDCWLRQQVEKLRAKLRRRRVNEQRLAEENTPQESVALEERKESASGPQRRNVTSASLRSRESEASTEIQQVGPRPESSSQSKNVGQRSEQPAENTDMMSHAIPVRIGIIIIATFFASFIAVLAARGALTNPPLPLDLFTNMYLAGTIIFGGGPVVIPLLRSYVVEPGWVSSRDFLIGLAIIQAFPGPNFNFGVYLGALALLASSQPTILGAFLGYVGIFLPGIALAVGVQSIWRVLRTKPPVVSGLKGINATAVGLVFTAVYRLWEIGYLTPQATQGQSLGREPWWVVVAAVTYAETAWFGVPPAAAIVFGAILGLCWYGAVGT
ncbi:chromate ion transporter [Lineolata rhizophorae]|uniref:Chromate ion transporter n=1 Tax=Lineolata rhizophorae TaxID=578093 RepID=A0A6A6PCQ3_9PEZI|nr:chromate ion transporter [Lineolata rhizophorae]